MMMLKKRVALAKRRINVDGDMTYDFRYYHLNSAS